MLLCIVLEELPCSEYPEETFVSRSNMENYWRIQDVEPYILHDHIVRGDAISRNEKKSLVVDFVQIAHFAPSNQGQRTLEIRVCKCLGHNCSCMEEELQQ